MTNKPIDYPVLPDFPTAEELADWRAAVAQLPELVEIPPHAPFRAARMVSGAGIDTEEAADRAAKEYARHRRNMVRIYHQQLMYAETAAKATAPAYQGQKTRLARVHLSHLDHHVALLMEQRASEASRADRRIAGIHVGTIDAMLARLEIRKLEILANNPTLAEATP